MADPLKDYLTVRQLVAQLGVSRQRVHQLIAGLPDQDVARTEIGVLIRRRALKALQARKTTPGRAAAKASTESATSWDRGD